MPLAQKTRRGRPKRDRVTLQQRREAILDAAAPVFARHGYQGAEIQLVADACGVAKGTIYLYFPGKEALFLAAVDRGMRRLCAAIDAAIDGIDDPLEQIAAAIRAYLQFFKDYPEYVELLIQERAEFRDRKKPTYFEHREENRERWRRALPRPDRRRPGPRRAGRAHHGRHRQPGLRHDVHQPLPGPAPAARRPGGGHPGHRVSRHFDAFGATAARLNAASGGR